MWCPSCGAEYRLGFTHCPDCDRDLVDEPPADLERATEVIEAAGVDDPDLDVKGGRDPAATDWDDDLSEEAFLGPWYSRPWGQVVMGLIALLVVISMIATYALE